MLDGTRTVVCASGVTALAVLLSLGVLRADAADFITQSAVVGPGVSLSSGVWACEPNLQDGLSEGSQCMAGWVVNQVLLDAATRFATTQGQALFGKRFRIVNGMSFAPFEGTTSGGLDVVLPLASPALPGSAPSETSTSFLQQGVTRWVDAHGLERNDFRFGAVRRIGLFEGAAASGVLGVSAFVQRSREFRHTRLVAGTDYAGKWGRGSLNVFLPATGWRSADARYDERALAGIELGLQLEPTSTLSMNTAIGQWERDDGFGGWSTNGRIALGWRPHRWLSVGVAWIGLGTPDDSKTIRVGFSMPLGETRGPPRWEGLGLVGAGSEPSALDPWAPVENIGAIQVARREGASVHLVSGAKVRFLQESANSGDRIRMEIFLPVATSRNLHLVVTLAPGTGDNPAVPGVDFVDEPIPVTIRAGTSSTVFAAQLPLNAELGEARSLRVTVALAS